MAVCGSVCRRAVKDEISESQRSKRAEIGKTVLEYGEQDLRCRHRRHTHTHRTPNLPHRALSNGYRYHPKTKTTREAFEQILSTIGKFLGDVPQDVLMGAADETLALLKDERIKVHDTRPVIYHHPIRNSNLVPRVSSPHFTCKIPSGQ